MEHCADCPQPQFCTEQNGCMFDITALENLVGIGSDQSTTIQIGLTSVDEHTVPHAVLIRITRADKTVEIVLEPPLASEMGMLMVRAEQFLQHLLRNHRGPKA